VQTTEEINQVRDQIKETPTRSVHFPLSRQLIVIFDIFLWLFIIVRIWASTTHSDFLDWVFGVSVWIVIVIAALLTLELLFLTIFFKQLVKAPLVLYTVFVVFVSIDVFIVILTLYWMGFITGMPPIGVI